MSKRGRTGLQTAAWAALVVSCGGARSDGAVEYASQTYHCSAKDVQVLEGRENEQVAAYWLDICGTHRRIAHLYDKQRDSARHYWKDVTPPLVRAFGSDQSRSKDEKLGRIRQQVDDLADRTITTLSYFVPEADLYVQVVADTAYPESYSLRYAAADVDQEFARFRSCKSFHGKADDYRWSSSRPDYDGQRRDDVMFELIGVGVHGEQLEKLARAKDARIRFCGTTFAFEPLQRGKLGAFLKQVGYKRGASSKQASASKPPTQPQAQTVLPTNVGVEPLESLGIFRFAMSLAEAQVACEGSRIAKRSGSTVHLLCPDARIAGTIDWDGAAAVFEEDKLVEVNFGWAAKSKQVANAEGVEMHGRILRTLIARLGEPASQDRTCEGDVEREGRCSTLTKMVTEWTTPNPVVLTLGEVSRGVYGIRLKARAR